MPEMWSGCGFSSGRGPLSMLGFIMVGVKMERLRRRWFQDYEIRVSECRKQGKGRDARDDRRQYAPSCCDHGERILGVENAGVPSVDVHLLAWPFRKRQATGHSRISDTSQFEDGWLALAAPSPAES